MRRSQFLAASAAAFSCRSSGRAVLRLDVVPSGHDVDPYRDPEFGIGEVAWLYADGLMGWGGGLVPLLAERFPDVLDGGLRYRYALRESRWHDGKQVTSDDVVDAVDAIKNGVRPPGSPAGANFWSTFEPYRSIREIRVGGRSTFDVVLDKPVRGFVRSFFAPYGRIALPLLRSSVDALPIGTGPFSVRARVDSNRWRLERSDVSRRGRPRVDAIDLRYFGDARYDVLPLMAGETDIAIPIPGKAPRDSRYRRVARVTGTTLLIFNMAGPFGDVALRWSFAKVVDVPLLQRRYDPTQDSLFASFLVGGVNDAALGRTLVHDTAAAGHLRDALAGKPVRILTLPHSTVDDVAQAIGSGLTNVGIAWELVNVQYAGLFGPNSPLRRGAFDVAVDSYVYGEDADLAGDWSCARRPPEGGNFARYCDPQFEGAIAIGDMAGALRRLYDQLVAIPLAHAREDIGVGRTVADFPSPPLLVPATYSCASWRLC